MIINKELNHSNHSPKLSLFPLWSDWFFIEDASKYFPKTSSASAHNPEVNLDMSSPSKNLIYRLFYIFFEFMNYLLFSNNFYKNMVSYWW